LHRARPTRYPLQQLCELQDADGIVFPLYHFLWMRNAKGEPCKDINLPHTVVYFRAHPVSWYFTSPNTKQVVRTHPNAFAQIVHAPASPLQTHSDTPPQLMRKKKENVTTELIDDALLTKSPVSAPHAAPMPPSGRLRSPSLTSGRPSPPPRVLCTGF
jgi:hypothetical protein